MHGSPRVEASFAAIQLVKPVTAARNLDVDSKVSQILRSWGLRTVPGAFAPERSAASRH